LFCHLAHQRQRTCMWRAQLFVALSVALGLQSMALVLA
jgi:hypothetical protein